MRHWNAVKTHCLHGHEFSPENTIITRRGQRECRTCSISRRQEWSRRAREAKTKTPVDRVEITCSRCGAKDAITYNKAVIRKQKRCNACLAEATRRRSTNPHVAEKRREQLRKYRNDPVMQKKASARLETAKAIRRGDLVRKPCEVCGDHKVHAHHPDYNTPLDVMWLCPKHHSEWHEYNEAKV